MMAITWLTLVLLPCCLGSVLPVKGHKFVAVPTKQEVPLLSNVTINCTTTDSKANTSVFFRKNPQKKTWKLLKPGTRKIVQEGPQIYTLINAVFRNTGYYQCRAWKGLNGTVIAWPDHAGRIIVKKMNSGSKKKQQGEKSSHKHPGNKKSAKKGRVNKKQDRKNRGKKKPGNKKRGKKGRKKSSKKRKKKRPKHKKKSKKRPSSKNSGKPESKKSNGKKAIPKKVTPLPFVLKSRRKVVAVVEGGTAMLNCVVKFKSSHQNMMKIRWYKDGKLISQKPMPAHLTITTVNKQSKRKYVSILKLKGFKTVRDQGAYQCRAIDKRLSSPLTITVKSKSS